MNLRLLSALGLVGAGIANAQVGPGPSPSPAPAPAKQPESKPAETKPVEPDPMTGPKVQPKAGEPTLIKYDLSGKLVRPEVSPDEAALELIGLDAGEKEAVNQILVGRAAILDGIVADNLPLLLKFQGVRTGDTPKEQMQALKDLTKVFEPYREMGPLRTQVEPHMATEKAAKYKQILQDYWAAVTQEDEETLKSKGKPMTASQIRGYETMLAFGAEVRRSYNRQIAAKIEQLNELLAKLNATPEQDAKIRTLTSDYFQKTAGKPTTQQRGDLFQAILKELNDDQRMTLLKELYSAKK